MILIYNIGETEARLWTIPEDFWDVLRDPLWKEWIEAIRKEMKGFEDNEVFLTTPRSEATMVSLLVKRSFLIKNSTLENTRTGD